MTVVPQFSDGLHKFKVRAERVHQTAEQADTVVDRAVFSPFSTILSV